MIRTDKRIRLCTALLVCNLIFIWGNSLLPGEVSGAFSDWVKEILESLFAKGPEEPTSGGLLRKLAHFTEFMGLGMLLCWRFGMAEQKKTHLAAFSFLGSLMAACTDETIQIFVDGRGSSLLDVWTDAFGAMTGIAVLFLGHHLIVKKHS